MTAKILLVEPDVSAQTLLAIRLKQQGLKVLLSNNGFDAVTTAQLEKPHIIVMSMELPRLNGFQAAEQLKASTYTQQIPIVAITTENTIEDARRCILVGCEGHVVKPVNIDQLMQQIRALLHVIVHS